MLIFPNAAKGIKYVYYSILLMIITLGLSIFTLLFGFFNFEDGNPLLLFVGFFVIAVAILAIVALDAAMDVALDVVKDALVVVIVVKKIKNVAVLNVVLPFVNLLLFAVPIVVKMVVAV